MVAFLQNIFTILSGPAGAAIVGMFLIVGIFECIGHKSIRPLFWSVIGGGAFFSIAWIMSSVMQGFG